MNRKPFNRIHSIRHGLARAVLCAVLPAFLVTLPVPTPALAHHLDCDESGTLARHERIEALMTEWRDKKKKAEGVPKGRFNRSLPYWAEANGVYQEIETLQREEMICNRRRIIANQR